MESRLFSGAKRSRAQRARRGAFLEFRHHERGEKEERHSESSKAVDRIYYHIPTLGRYRYCGRDAELADTAVAAAVLLQV